MIKRIIFDIDNTLIEWKEEYFEEIRYVLKKHYMNCSDEEFKTLRKAFAEYENNIYTFDRKLMLEFIEKYTNKKYPNTFIYELTDRWSRCMPDKLDDGIIDTLKYLKDKYELVILTDWYVDQQIVKLKALGIYDLFEKIYSAENNIKRKPFKEAFMQAIGENKPEECIMIGDSIERDVKGAIDAGLNAIWFNHKKEQSTYNYTEIKNISELKEIL